MEKKITKHYELPEIMVKGKKPLRYIMKPEDLLDFISSLTGGLFSFFSPTQIARKIYDVSKSIKNKEGIDKVGKALFQTNSGIVTKKFEREHPIGAAITNLIGDVAIPAGLFGTAKGINYLARMDMPRFGFKPSTNHYFTPGYVGSNGNPVSKIPDGYTFIKEATLQGRNGTRKVHLVKENSTGKTRILEDLLFKSELDWSKNWFESAGRKYKDGSTSLYTDKDIESLKSHIPEYLKIEREAKLNGTWLKMPDGSTWEGDPRSWVQYKSQAALLYNPEVFITGIHKEINPEYEEILWGLPTSNQPKLSWARARTYTNLDSKVFPMFTRKYTDPKLTYKINANGLYWQAIKDKNGKFKITDDIVKEQSKKKIVKIDNVIDIGDKTLPSDSKYFYKGIGNNELIPLNNIVIQPKTFRKSLIGNNGDFKHPTNMYRGLIPLFLSNIGYQTFKE